MVVVEASGDVRHEGLALAMEGCVNLQLSTKNVGIFEAFSNSIKVKIEWKQKHYLFAYTLYLACQQAGKCCCFNMTMFVIFYRGLISRFLCKYILK